MDNTNQHDDGDERLAGDLLVGADKIREFLVSLGVPEKTADPYYLKRSGNGWPIGSTAAGGGRTDCLEAPTHPPPRQDRARQHRRLTQDCRA